MPLAGKLEAIHTLRAHTTWEALRCPGDTAEVDVDWNKGVGMAADEAAAGKAALRRGQDGRFCAYCACRTPQVHARHRYL